MKYVVFLFLGLNLSAHAQMSDSLSNYYYYINQAEVMIAENNLLGAKGKFEKAKQHKSNWFGRDYYNLALVELKLGETKEMAKTLKKLVAKGFDLRLLVEKESFETYFSTKKGEKLLAKLKLTKPIYNVELRAIYDSLHIEDSTAHELFKPDSFSHVVGKVDSANIELMMRLIEEYGFPDESLIGIHGWFKVDNILSLFVHHMKHPQLEERIDFKELMLESAEKGLIKNYDREKFVFAAEHFGGFNYAEGIIKWKIKEKTDTTTGVTTFSDSLYTFFDSKGSEEQYRSQTSKGLTTGEESFKLSKFNWEVNSDFIIGRNENQTHEIIDLSLIKFLNKNAVRVEIKEY